MLSPLFFFQTHFYPWTFLCCCGAVFYLAVAFKQGIWCSPSWQQAPFAPHNGNAAFCCFPGTYLGSGETAWTAIAANRATQQKCAHCPTGRYTDVVNLNRTCTACPKGWYQTKTNKQFCLPCNAGTFTDQLNTTECQHCPQNTFTNTTALSAGFTACEACPTAKASDPGASSCFQCEPGQYMLHPNVVGFSTTKTCTTCPEGWTSVYGETKCDECTQGKFVNGLVCDLCGAGTYGKPNLEAQDRTSAGAACDACPQGTYSSATGVVNATDCNKCAAGKKNPNNGSTLSADCTTCVANTKSEDEGSSGCVGCDAGKSSDPGSTKCQPCEAGTFSNVTGEDCQNCGVGQYRPSKEDDGVNTTDPTTCVDCPTGYSSSAGSTKCQTCGAGTYGNGCQPCAKGEYRNGSDPVAVSCRHCPTGYYSDDVGQGSCLPCIPVSFIGD